VLQIGLVPRPDALERGAGRQDCIVGEAPPDDLQADGQPVGGKPRRYRGRRVAGEVEWRLSPYFVLYRLDRARSRRPFHTQLIHSTIAARRTSVEPGHASMVM
jgi:hypothetical protein